MPTSHPLPTIQPEPLGRLYRINNKASLSPVEFLGTVISGSPPYPDQRADEGMSGTGFYWTRFNLRTTLVTALSKNPQVSVLWGPSSTSGKIKDDSLCIAHGRSKVPSYCQQAVSTIGKRVPEVVIVTPAGSEAAVEERGVNWARSIRRDIPIQIEAPIKKILRRLRNRGLIAEEEPWPIHCLLDDVSDGRHRKLVRGIAKSPLSYYKDDNRFNLASLSSDRVKVGNANNSPALESSPSSESMATFRAEIAAERTS
ncbi:hypothetical protein Tco_0940580 [Tanacetum coccineum]|uniref:Uncharacterized protein n=1 Tax=Tanacetum coccineum TaxID=301880 RepID=A0ABQ5DNE9_9ASTR